MLDMSYSYLNLHVFFNQADNEKLANTFLLVLTNYAIYIFGNKYFFDQIIFIPEFQMIQETISIEIQNINQIL